MLGLISSYIIEAGSRISTSTFTTVGMPWVSHKGVKLSACGSLQNSSATNLQVPYWSVLVNIVIKQKHLRKIFLYACALQLFCNGEEKTRRLEASERILFPVLCVWGQNKPSPHAPSCNFPRCHKGQDSVPTHQDWLGQPCSGRICDQISQIWSNRWTFPMPLEINTWWDVNDK